MSEKELPMRKTSLPEEIREIFSRFADEWPDLAPLNKNGYVPHVDILEKVESYVIKAEIPGMRGDDIIVTLEKNVLVIEGEKKSESVDKDNYIKSEISYGPFYRTFELKEMVNEDLSEGYYNNGVLRIVLKKSKLNKKNKRIVININRNNQNSGYDIDEHNI